MFCANCGTQLSDDVKFCPNCGRPQQERIQDRGTTTESQTNLSRDDAIEREVASLRSARNRNLISTARPGTKQTPTTESAQYASLIARVLAFIVDYCIAFFSLIVVGIGNALDKTTGCVGCPPNNSAGIFSDIMALAWLVALVLYYVVGEGKYGQTLGKRLLKIRVVRAKDGNIPGYGRVFLREVLHALFLGAVGITIGLAFLWATWDGKKQTWYDKIAGTTVVKAE